MFKLHHYAVILIMIFGFTVNSYSASFDCSKASTLVENAICSDDELSDLDDLLMDTYKKALANTDDKASLKTEQRAWLKNVRNKCQNVSCIKSAYKERISSINNKIEVNMSVPDNVKWEGEWNRINYSRHEASGLTIKDQTPKGFDFSIDATSGGNSGQIEGRASFIKQNAVYKDSDSGCSVEFKIKDNCIDINTTDKCSDFGGIGVYFDGTYCKGKQQTKQTTNYFIDIGVFKNTADVNVFKKIVGNSYDLFEESFQLVSEEKDMDNISATVFTGGVKGLFTTMEGIIMQCPDGKIYAAVIDNDTVNFFSNDTQYSNKLPITIDNWRENFKDKDVMFFVSKH